MPGRLLDALAYSSLLLAAAAAALVAAAYRALESPFEPRIAALAAAGTLVVYNVDRLRDLERDRETAPCRSAFVEANRPLLLGLTVGGSLTAAALAWREGPALFAWLVPVAAAGLFHRRLKRFTWGKGLYIALAWTAVVVGLPWLTAEAAQQPGITAGILALAIYANAIASNIRDAEAGAARFGLRRALYLARCIAAASLLLALAGPPPVRPLLAVPLLTLASLLTFRSHERYGLLVVDGALLAGGLLAALSP